VKVNNINNRLSISNKLSFEGYDVKKDNYGDKYYKFSYPCDYKRYDCYLVLVDAIPQENGDYKIGKTLHNYEQDANRIKLNPGENNIDIQYAYRLAEKQPFAYQYQLVPKSNPDAIPMFRVESGDLLDETDTGAHNIFNLVVPSGATSNKAGAAILICQDNYDVRWKYDENGEIKPNPDAKKGLDTAKTFANHIGGTAAGIEKNLDNGNLDIYSKIFLLPFSSGDSVSAHNYWLESAYQLSGAMGNMQTFSRLQQKLFAKGKNLVCDAAITSEGLAGIHFQSILHYGEDNVFFDWFKCNSLKDTTAKIGAFGKRDAFIRHKLINAPFIPVQDANGKIILKPCKYDKKSPTYIQVYDAHAASDEQMADNSPLIKQYGKNIKGGEILKTGTHNDTLIAYSYPIDPEVYAKNVKNFNEYNSKQPTDKRISLNSYEATRMLTKFENFEFDNKFEGGFYTWDANVDMVKFNYNFSNSDVEDIMHLPLKDRKAAMDNLLRKNSEVQDYAISSVKYWTRKTNQILNLYTAQALKNVNERDAGAALRKINEQISNNVLPQKLSYEINKELIQNVLDGSYTLHGMDSVENFHDTILDGLMEFPLESAELGKDILSLFSTPYMTKRATAPDQIGKSRMDMLREGNPHLTNEYADLYNRTTYMYSDTMYAFAKDIIDELNSKLPEDLKLNKFDDTSAYGKYVLPLITQEIAKFAVMKGLIPNLKYHIDETNGGIIYDSSSKNSSLKSLGIRSISQKRDTDELISKLNSGIKNIKDSDKKELVKAIRKMIAGTNLTSFKLAEMIVDRAKGGIDFRFDAAKDVSDMDSLRNTKDTFEDNWNQVIKFWKNAADAIYKENPNSYLVAELTDELDLHSMGNGANSERFFYYKEEDNNKPYYYRNDINRKFLRETGITATANYNYFFTDVAGIFGKLGENGDDRGTDQGYRVHNILRKGKWGEEFLFSGPYESILKSYTFVDNHDKPRILHILSMDMGLFYADLNDINNYDYRKRAYAVLHPNAEAKDFTPEAINSTDFSYVSAKAVARGEALNSAFYRAIEVMKNGKDKRGNYRLSPDVKDKLFTLVQGIIARLCSGEYGGKTFDADNVGVEEVQKLINLITTNIKNLNVISDEQCADLEAETFAQALKPAMSNALAMDKFLINLPGIPTTYAGDDLGATGYETKTKNMYLKNRAAVHHDWAEKFEFIKEHKSKEDNVKLMRSRPVLHALNDGAPFQLKLQKADGKDVAGLLRYATDGSMVVSLFNVAGTTHTFDNYTDASKAGVKLQYNQINLDRDGETLGLHGGLTPGMEFINANDENDKYYVYQGEGDMYYIAHDKNCTQEIELKDNTLTLYHASDELRQRDSEFLKKVKKAREEKISFCGNRRVLDTMQYNVSPAVYKPIALKSNSTTGNKLELVSR